MTSFLKVSVIMPVYNAEKYLRESIESILNQTLKDFEFIIINDASSDNSLEIIKSYSDPRIILISNSENLGSATTMNRGIRLAKGEYIARMDSDDISLPERLHEQVRYMDSSPKVGVCGSWVSVIGDDHEYIWKYESEPERLKSRILFDCGLAFPTVMMRRSMISQNNLYFNEKFRRAEDFEFWARSIEFFQLGNIPKALLKYRLNSNQTSHKFEESYQQWTKEIRMYQLKRLGIEPSEEELDVHDKIANYHGKTNESFLIKSEQWLDKLILHNSRIKFYEDNSFKNIVGFFWYVMLVRNLAFKKIILKKLFKSPLSNCLNFKQRIKIFFKCLLYVE